MEWIPCSKRLPRIKSKCCYEDGECKLYESEPVLVWGRHGEDEFEYGLATLVLDKIDGSQEWSGYVGVSDAYACEIVAWCPLPKPYNEISLPVSR